jgi:fructose-bisphosphate aldolase class I
MNVQILKDTIQQLFANNKGLLAMDESTSTCNKRFAAAGIPQTVEMRRKYRELIVTTPGLNESIGGAILFDETIRQHTTEGVPMADVLKNSGIIPGIKVDKHAKPMAGFAGEKITEGLDDLRERLDEYKSFGLRFAKWRAVFSISESTPTEICLDANAHALSQYAALCQEADVVPIVEPEVLMNGKHGIQQCFEVTRRVQEVLFYTLYKYRINLEGMILKPNMVIQGLESDENNSPEVVAETTVNCMLASVPADVPAVAFLSGGQSPQEASAHLNAINKNFKNRIPWTVSFSFARAIQQPALEAWHGEDSNIETAQNILYERAKLDSAARRGAYSPAMET